VTAVSAVRACAERGTTNGYERFFGVPKASDDKIIAGFPIKIVQGM
jgi:hypothetical protein